MRLQFCSNFLPLLVLLCLVACGGGPGDDPVEGASFFDTWREVRDRLRQSPDHRTARADALVAAGDAEAIFAFVRDEISAIPSQRVDSYVPPQLRTYFGPRGTLRGGMGTPRDKVELLKWLLERAGYPAAVKIARPDAEHRDPTLLYRPAASSAFAPPITEADLARWKDTFAPGTIEGSSAVVDPGMTKTLALAGALTRTLSDADAAAPIDADLDNAYLPFVEVEIDGVPMAMNPLWPDARPGDSLSETVVYDAEPPRSPEVRVRVWARSGRDVDADSGQTLVEGVWNDADLVGRRLVWRARPLMDLPEMLATRLGQIPLFLPILSVESSELDAEEASRLVEVGPAFSTLGWRVEKDAEGRAIVNGIPLGTLEDDATQRARVERIEVEVTATRFPEVELTIAPRDAAGDIVTGLGGASFVIGEDGQAVTGFLTRNQRIPRLLLLLDNSGSVPPAFQGEQRTILGRAIAERVLAIDDAQMVIMGVGEPEFQWKEWTSDPAEIEAQLANVSGGGSPLWESLLAAVRRRPTVIVYITDGAALGSGLTADEEAFVADAGVPALVLGVGAQDEATLQAMADLTGGTYVPVEAQAEVLDQIDVLLADDSTPYRMTYLAPVEGNATREVEVAIRESTVRGSSTYSPPTSPRLMRGLFGLYITVERGGVEVTRTIAGLPYDAPSQDADASHLVAVRSALFGTTSLIVEGGPPSFAELLDERLAAQLSLEAAWDARHDEERFWDVLRDGFLSSPLEPYLLALGPEWTDETPVAPVGARYWLYSVIPAEDEARSIRRIDILPMTRWMGISSDAKTAWAAALKRTVSDAVLEDAYFERSTISVLDGKSLEAVPAEDLATHFAGAPNLDLWLRSAQAFDRNWTLLVPADPEAVTFWAVHEESGTAIAILPGGSGGGETPGGGGRAAQTVDLAEAIAELHSLSGLGGGFWIELEVAKAKIVAYATAAIETLGGNGGPEFNPDLDPESVVEDLVCGTVEGAVVDRLPESLQDALEQYNDFAGATGLPEGTACD